MSNRKRVLVWETDECLCRQLEWALVEWGFEATTTQDFAEAIDLLYARDFDLVLVGEPPDTQCARELLRMMREMRCPARAIALAPEYAADAADMIRLGSRSRTEEPWCDQILKIASRHFADRATFAAA
ncbi:MAG: response regulator [Terriglobales bacterium]|jgi:DNA-binding NtrC family response regulator